ncbi:low-density lipoprotein receptor-related protein 8-like [Microplitis mediator]|uniref:low-density lipoprotein receptor-related protein 8-like n=1 Tax=Microplitis mediator TaxID=375433 RepID=UPI002555566B|nr:low-density lipoprotein receptor-related protein 8-like [Microplitis mediator]
MFVELLGTTCSNDDDCKDLLHMKCSENKICTCRPHHVIKNNATCASLLGGYCQHDEQCGADNSVCIDNKCQCKAHLKSISIDKCVPTKLGKFCLDILDCEDVLHLSCSDNHQCECKKNHIIVNNSTCLPLLDEYCWFYEKCAPENSVCSFNTCQCKPNYLQRSNNQCIPSN